MATRQYIGARYVPKFYQNSVDGSTQWEANVVYEPLTWVTLINGHMYISKKQVPATVGTPTENIEYWLDIGSYNGMITDLQNQIDAITDVLTPLATDVGGLKNDVTDLKYLDVFVTPEMFGAVGDGITDDTAAMQQAISDGKPVYLSKTYYCATPIVDNAEKNLVILGGKQATLKNTKIVKNMDTSTYQWVHAYSTELLIDGVDFEGDTNDTCIATGAQTVIRNCRARNINSFVKEARGAYLDCLILENVTLNDFTTRSGLTSTPYIGEYTSNGGIDSVQLGDMHHFINVHISAGSSATTNHGRIFGNFYGMESLVFDNCLNIRGYFSQSTVLFTACHFEDVSGIKDSDINNSVVTFIGCMFLQDSYKPSKARYVGCKCYCIPMDYRWHNSPDVSFVATSVPKEVDIIVSHQTGRVGTPFSFNDEGGQGPSTMNSCVLDLNAVTADSQLTAGSYEYKVYTSISPKYVLGRNTPTTKTITITSGQIVELPLTNTYCQVMWTYIERTDPNNNVKWAMIPPRKDILRLFDYGDFINGTAWQSGSAPTKYEGNVFGMYKNVVLSASSITYAHRGFIQDNNGTVSAI